jgi:hypothetical protein
MTHPVRFHYSAQHNLIFWCIEYNLIEAYFGNRIQGVQLGFFDPPRGVGPRLWVKQLKPPSRRKEKGKDGMVGGLLKNTS